MKCRALAHHKNVALITQNTVLVFDSVLRDSSLFVAKDSSSICYRVDWCINHRIQSNLFVGKPVEVEE